MLKCKKLLGVLDSFQDTDKNGHEKQIQKSLLGAWELWNCYPDAVDGP